MGLSFLALCSKFPFSPEEQFFGFGLGGVGLGGGGGRLITPPPVRAWISTSLRRCVLRLFEGVTVSGFRMPLVVQELQPAIIFVDEIDSLLTARSDHENESSRRMKTEFMVQMEGLSVCGEAKNVLCLGATNRPYELDDAILRRFPKRLLIPLPDAATREQLFVRYGHAGGGVGQGRTRCSGGGGDEGKKVVHLKWASHFWFSVQNLIVPERNIFLVLGEGVGRPDQPPPPCG